MTTSLGVSDTGKTDTWGRQWGEAWNSCEWWPGDTYSESLAVGVWPKRCVTLGWCRYSPGALTLGTVLVMRLEYLRV